MEIAGRDALVAVVQDAHPDHGAAYHQEVVPLRGSAEEQLGMDPERIEVIGDAFRRCLLEALMIGVVGA